MTVGQYDVVMDTGPGYNSKRQEAVESMLPILAADPSLMQSCGDLVFRNMDWPGADVIADHLAAANPLAQIDEHSDIPPQVQMQLAQGKKQVEDLQQQLQWRSVRPARCVYLAYQHTAPCAQCPSHELQQQLQLGSAAVHAIRH
jgi:hypothetical protein